MSYRTWSIQLQSHILSEWPAVWCTCLSSARNAASSLVELLCCSTRIQKCASGRSQHADCAIGIVLSLGRINWIWCGQCAELCQSTSAGAEGGQPVCCGVSSHGSLDTTNQATLLVHCWVTTFCCFSTSLLDTALIAKLNNELFNSFGNFYIDLPQQGIQLTWAMSS